MGNRKSLEPWNSGTLEPWNSGTFLPRPTDLNPLTGNLIGFDHRFYCPSSPSGKWKDLLPFASRFTLNKQSSALKTQYPSLRSTLYALRWNSETLEHWNTIPSPTEN